MLEVEIKLPLKGKISIEAELLGQGFVRGELVKETDIYFNGKERDFKKRGEALRIRRIEHPSTGASTSVITFKGQKSDLVSMTREELEVGVEEPNICEEIFLAIGLQPMRPVVKQRQYYHRNRMTACLDQVEGLGDFLEIEILVAGEDEREEALGEIEDALGKIGYSMPDTVRTSYLSMLQKKD